MPQLKAATQFWNRSGNQYVRCGAGQLFAAPGFEAAGDFIMRLMACMIWQPLKFILADEWLCLNRDPAGNRAQNGEVNPARKIGFRKHERDQGWDWQAGSTVSRLWRQEGPSFNMSGKGFNREHITGWPGAGTLAGWLGGAIRA
jgi:hypothetical protein